MFFNLEEHKKEASAVMASTNQALTVLEIETVRMITWGDHNSGGDSRGVEQEFWT